MRSAAGAGGSRDRQVASGHTARGAWPAIFTLVSNIDMGTSFRVDGHDGARTGRRSSEFRDCLDGGRLQSRAPETEPCHHGAMPYEEIDGVPIWYEEHGDPDGPPVVALHGGITTFEGSFGDVLPWLEQGRRVIGVELQGHGHTPDTGRSMSIERFADDVAELVDRVAGGGPVDLWGFSLGALTATGVAVRHPSRVRRLVLAAVNIRPDGYHPEITAPEQDDPRLPSEQEFAAWHAAYEAVAPDPSALLRVPRAATAGRPRLAGLDRRRDPRR